MVELAEIVNKLPHIQAILKKYDIQNAFLLKGRESEEKDFTVVAEFIDEKTEYIVSVNCAKELGDFLDCDVLMETKEFALRGRWANTKEGVNLLSNSTQVKIELENYFGKEWIFNKENSRDIEEEFERDNLRGWCNVNMCSKIPKTPMSNTHYLVKEEQEWQLFHTSSIRRLGKIDIDKVSGLREALKDLPDKLPQTLSSEEKIKVEEAITIYREIDPKRATNSKRGYFFQSELSKKEKSIFAIINLETIIEKMSDVKKILVDKKITKALLFKGFSGIKDEQNFNLGIEFSKDISSYIEECIRIDKLKKELEVLLSCAVSITLLEDFKDEFLHNVTQDRASIDILSTPDESLKYKFSQYFGTEWKFNVSRHPLSNISTPQYSPKMFPSSLQSSLEIPTQEKSTDKPNPEELKRFEKILLTKIEEFGKLSKPQDFEAFKEKINLMPSRSEALIPKF